MIMKFAFIDQPNPLPVSASAPEPSIYLLPATTYSGTSTFERQRQRSVTTHDGGLSSQRTDRPISLYPGGQHYTHTHTHTHTHARKQSNVSVHPPRISYTPEERPISFTFPREAHDVEAARDARRLLCDIDDAIEQCFRVAAEPEERLVATTYEVLPSTTYDARHGRKDSAVPWSACGNGREKDLPPVPVDGK
jgi:hypothetical protein